jgi:dephospho-CoA kinase
MPQQGAMNGQRVFAVIRKIGLTGGIASGKSQVAEMLVRMIHCVHIDADDVCRRLLERQAEGWREFSRVFGSKYFTEDGSINRALLRKDLFADKDFRQKINNVIHPLVKKTIVAQMDQIIASDNNSRVLVEVPLLYEVQWENLFDTVVVVYADNETCLHRLMERDGGKRSAAIRELQSQLPLSEKAMQADFVIDNSGMLPDTYSQVEHLAELLRSNSEHPDPGIPRG